MIRRTPLLDSFERSYLAGPLDVGQRLRLMESLYQEARLLGVFPPANPLEGIDVDIRRSRILNGLRKDP